MGVRGQPTAQIERVADGLVRLGWIERSLDSVRLTSRGLEEARQMIRKHRLWELYLTMKLDIESDRVHRDAEQMEHALTEETVAEIERVLGHPRVDPHGRPIPPGRPA
ncbi:MAG: hypothetical protein HC882_03420 [Acidobacteria bacterium]|nr:hypothetical protein [Acidobacteriota bacterium]